MTAKERSEAISLFGLMADSEAERIREDIMDAIKTAVIEEREACAYIARDIAVGYLRGPQIEGFGRFAEIADKINQRILDRNKL